MQFEYSHNIGKNEVSVQLKGALPFNSFQSIFETFQKIGGYTTTKVCANWNFPLFITSQVIQTIINNTCFVCGGLMQDSVVEKIQWVVPDGNMKVSTKVRKCTFCGHSHT